MLQPQEEAGQLAAVVLNEVVHIHQLQRDLLRQTLQVPLFDLQIGHVQDLVEDLVQLHWIEVGLR